MNDDKLLRQSRSALTLAALGVVYGDIGTSPLYAVKETFNPRNGIPLRVFLESLLQCPPQRVPGTSVFLTATPDAVPHALLHNFKHNRVLHERVVFLTVIIKEVPWVSFSERVVIESLGHDC